MHKSRAIYFILTGLFVIFSCTFIHAQTTDRANIKSKPQMLQTNPQMDIQKKQAEELIKSLPRDRQKTFKAVSTIMTNQLIENLQSNKSEAQKEDDAIKIIAAGMEKTAIITNAANEQALIQNTQSALIYASEATVRQASVKVETINHIKQVMQEEITALKDLLTDWADDPIVQEVNYRSCIKLSDGRYEIVEKTVVISKEQVEALIADLENQLDTMADMSQELQHHLQDTMNKQSKIMQIMSNIMKNMHDTAKAIIHNMR
jgi:hypothetical protein